LPQEIADAIEAFPLDVSGLRVMLRRYQEFGAKFVLQQRRVLLGDDMGLGKTIQALAAMAHLSKEHPDFRALVIAPASVLVNWNREIAAKSDLIPAEPEDWASSGGVLVTTFERVRKLSITASMVIHLLVVDEAHYIKNPEAQRTQRVEDLLEQSERVLFMTGTAIENRGAEFVELVRLLDPAVAALLTGPAALVAPQEFRARVAPLYLRRNADEVLTELPALIEVDEWEEMTNHDVEHYRRAVAAGNLMAMRRAGFMAGSMRSSAKLIRLLELVAEAADSGHKVIVYSYFLDVIDIVQTALGGAVFGPITGATSPVARQCLVDEFTAAAPGAVLVSQIIAGGVGLNIQAASVVILCEPQFKPSTENQAIARARRMGQLKTVQVHRLLNPDSIDERILEILEAKTTVFDDYARESDLADASGDAIDPRAALRLVSDERERLGLEQEPTEDGGAA
jgi:SNF2 family DNA or RNA helicase